MLQLRLIIIFVEPPPKGDCRRLLWSQTSPLPEAAADSVESRSTASGARRPRWGVAAFLVLALAVVLVSSVNTPQARFFVAERFQTFVTVFLSLFIEAAPFLLVGSIVSGIIAVYVNQEMVERYIPDHPLLAALTGAGLGLVFPVCECGVVPVTRRLYGKGLPLPVGIAFLLAAPVINPVVIFSTFAAFGWGPVLWGRVVFSVLVAFAVGLIFHLARPQERSCCRRFSTRQLAPAAATTVTTTITNMTIPIRGPASGRPLLWQAMTFWTWGAI